jgi:hypothetical protein
VVTDDCPELSTSNGTATGVRTGKPAVGYTLRSTQPYSGFATTLPGGFRFSKFTAADVTVAGTTGTGASAQLVTVKKVSVKGGILAITLGPQSRGQTHRRHHRI